MKHPATTVVKSILVAICCTLNFSILQAQDIRGSWQLVKETSCLEKEMGPENDSIQAIADVMKSMTPVTPEVIRFKEKSQGEQSTRILNKKKTTNNKNFLYKFTGESLLILDKKSQTLTDTYTVDRLDQDSLILSNSSRACETKVFIKIKEAKN
jgi:hypothetical protein